MVDIFNVYDNINYKFIVLLVGFYFFMWSVMLFFGYFVDMVFVKEKVYNNKEVIGRFLCYNFFKGNKRNICV